jgi:hypothetical protein
LNLLKKTRGETMTTPIVQNAEHPIPRRSEAMQDFLPVSSFGLWTALLGLMPVLAFHLLMASWGASSGAA